ncbi:MAG: hypothetical protein A2W80_10665 [Candidatus Riflebacteria bacterium GWC2_50_8]|nr:MAG: hypothetical protein A2W80_10665 [Candidatus Riflebacteria bacterium GWC2_50_8]
MIKNNFSSRNGIALPLVLVFSICVMVFTASLVFFRKESKQQNLTNIHFLQANFLAQSAVQMMLLKLSAFPQEACDAGVLSLGYCPFRGIIAGSALNPIAGANQQGLIDFYSDCNSDRFPWKVPGITAANWKFATTDFKVISAYTNPGERQLIISSQITALGEANLPRGEMGVRKEEMIKTVKLTREN